MSRTFKDTPDRRRAITRQLLRASNAAVPIPMGQRKIPRATAKQALRQEYR
jgi:hypothetical protein